MGLGSARGVVQATMRPLIVLAALALLGTMGVPSTAAAQVKAPVKAKLKPADSGQPTSRQVAFAERLARIKRRAVPDECFRDRQLLSRWIDSNR